MAAVATFRWTKLGFLLAATSALVALLVLSPTGQAQSSKSAANSVTFTDSAGEDPLAPDITSIVVSNDDNGMITWRINTPNKATLTGDMLFLLLIDSDSNSGTGENGFDYALELDGPLTGSASIGLFRWNGTDYVGTGVPQSSLTFSYQNGPIIRLNRSELGGTARFGFWTIAVSGIVLSPTGEPDFTNIHRDFAPRSARTRTTSRSRRRGWSCGASGCGRSRRGRAGPSTPSSPSHGATARPPRRRLSPAGRRSVGGALPSSGSSVTGTRASCLWPVPRTGKGKLIRGTITVQADGLRVSRPFSARVAA